MRRRGLFVLICCLDMLIGCLEGPGEETMERGGGNISYEELMTHSHYIPYMKSLALIEHQHRAGNRLFIGVNTLFKRPWLCIVMYLSRPWRSLGARARGGESAASCASCRCT